MKKQFWFSFLVLGVFLSLFSVVHASRVLGSENFTVHQNDKVKIKKEELPEAARKTLDGDAFKGWSIVTVYKTKEGEYEVELKKDATTQTVKFDKEGKAKIRT